MQVDNGLTEGLKHVVNLASDNHLRQNVNKTQLWLMSQKRCEQELNQLNVKN